MDRMLLSSQHQERLRDALRETPLQAGEMRRVEWAGEQYIALADTLAGRSDQAEFTELYRLRIDQIPCVVYARILPQSPVN
ncbi:MAG TPA: hypothetical protein VGE31_00595 [Candidatus Paceibacterota bacterium]